ncbi:hypothetical protein LNKW23_22840 [Paralimibaculum aggregatum]|uniref:Uncharacterized protein n=1 Tax=Paralimibaculum aggregatum TaxID=3036245 RepID=A0ABQ6LIG0_9RHOB|nr:hypothetical protein [Limibaculum sp. NKW23]GMG83071.1 hypothetical protein LNKW23_22840 [Limibaculum sp. NKW23]
MIDRFDRLLPDRVPLAALPVPAPVADPPEPPAAPPRSRADGFWQGLVGGYLALASIAALALALPPTRIVGWVMGAALVLGLPAYLLIGCPAFWQMLRRMRPGQSLAWAGLRTGFLANFGTLPLYALGLLALLPPAEALRIAASCFLLGFPAAAIMGLAAGMIAERTLSSRSRTQEPCR